MVAYLISAAVGILVGVIYAVLQVKSPAPPVVALIGLFGILIGENGFPLIKEKFFASKPAVVISEKVALADGKPKMNKDMQKDSK